MATATSLAGDKDKNNEDRTHPSIAKSKTKIVVKKKKKKSLAALQRARNNSPEGGLGRKSRGNAGLPTFQPRIPDVTDQDAPNTNNYSSPHLDFDDDEHDDEELPSDTLMAIQSLLQGSQGLYIPLLGVSANTTTASSSAVQVLLESQIFQRFQENHASTIWSELRRLTQSNQLRQISCRGGGSGGGSSTSASTLSSSTSSSSMAYIRTKDFAAGVWDAQQYHQLAIQQYEPIVSWFLSGLSHWTGSIISKVEMEEQWNNESLLLVVEMNRGVKRPISLDDAIRYLSRIQVLIRDTSTTSTSVDEECFWLWLPQWGLVLRSWNEARQQLLGVVARSQGREVSEQNILNKNRHSSVSTKFLLDELKHHGLLRTVERPFGIFIQRVDQK